MTDREKLVVVLGEFLLWPAKMKNVWMPQGIEKLADHLLSHGVTVQEWISVKERLPEETKDEHVLVVCDYHGKIEVETRKMWNIDSAVTHWMPLPEPPKEK